MPAGLSLNDIEAAVSGSLWLAWAVVLGLPALAVAALLAVLPIGVIPHRVSKVAHDLQSPAA